MPRQDDSSYAEIVRSMLSRLLNASANVPSVPPLQRSLSPLGSNRQAEGIQADKAFGIFLPIDLLFFKRRDIETVQRMLRLPSDHRAVALVQLHPHGPRHIFLCFIHPCL